MPQAPLLIKDLGRLARRPQAPWVGQTIKTRGSARTEVSFHLSFFDLHFYLSR
jgi:hypothetical protein